MEKIYKIHRDSRHGWLEVDLEEVGGIADKISGYSYINAGKIYLEEDVDAALMGEVPYVEIYDGDNSPIRSFKHYKGGRKNEKNL